MANEVQFEKFLRPASVAVVGASARQNTPGNSIVRILQRHGYEGRIYPVSPSTPEIEGLKAYKNVGELTEPVDLALVITPSQTVPGIVADCGRKGIRNVIVFSAGFEEVEGGKDLALQLAEAAREGGVAVMGPNCQGVWSVRDKSIMTFTSAALRLENLRHAPIAVISQSGALAGAIGNSLQSAGLGCSYIVSVGNETALDALDALECLIEQDDVRVVALYIEGLNNAARILAIAERARERGVQIVVLKAGRSAVGQQATASHTGKIASSHAVYSDVLAQAGVIAVDTLGELLAAVEVLGFLKAPRQSGDAKGGITVLSSSGGAGALLADHSSERGVPLSEFSAATAAELEKILPEHARKANPIDLTGAVVANPKLFDDTCASIGRDPRTEAVIVQFSGGGRRYLKENGEAFKALAREVPVAVSFVGENLERDLKLEFLQAGVLLCPEPAVAMGALALLYQRERARDVARIARREPQPQRAAPADWAAMMAWLQEAGMTPAKWTVLGANDRAATACADMKYPLVVKVLPSESEHKTELGLVKLRVRSAEEVDQHAADFRARLCKPSAGILVQEMVDDGVEVVVSCLRNTDFGPVLSLGTGGVAIELYRDVTHLALPVTEEQVLAALRKLKLWTLLTGFRGKPAADVQALARAAVRFGDMFLATPGASEFEINPVLVKPAVQGLSAVDALVTQQ